MSLVIEDKLIPLYENKESMTFSYMCEVMKGLYLEKTLDS